jgi:hypothetical protein
VWSRGCRPVIPVLRRPRVAVPSRRSLAWAFGCSHKIPLANPLARTCSLRVVAEPWPLPYLEITQTLQRVNGQLRFVPPKTRTSLRTIPLPPVCVAALKDHAARQAQQRAAAGMAWHECGLVFASQRGMPMEPDNLRRSWDRIKKIAGVSLRFHDLRHTCVTLLLDLGIPPHVVREIAGHAGLDVAMTIYAHASLEEKYRALNRLDERIAEEAMSSGWRQSTDEASES